MTDGPQIRNDPAAGDDPLLRGKPPRHLHIVAAVAIATVGLGAYALQSMLGAARAGGNEPAIAVDKGSSELNEPRIDLLQSEINRQQATPSRAPQTASERPMRGARGADAQRAAAEPRTAPRAATDAAAAAEQPVLQRYQADKQDNTIASSKILALQHAAPGIAEPPPRPALLDRAMPTEPPPVAGGVPGGAAGIELLKRVERIAAEAGGDRAAAGRDWLAARRQEADAAPLAAPVAVARPAASRYLIVQGSVLPAVLLTQIRSDLPGVLSAQVTDDVYDSISAAQLLIPRGTRLVGEYDSRVLDGQSSVLAAFDRMIFPNGSSVRLGAMPAAESSGAAGVAGEVNSHFWARFGTQFLTAALARAVERSNGSYGVLGPGGVVAASDAAGQILVEAMRGTRNVAALGPTITIRRGARFDIVVNRDLALDPAITGAR